MAKKIEYGSREISVIELEAIETEKLIKKAVEDFKKIVGTGLVKESQEEPSKDTMQSIYTAPPPYTGFSAPINNSAESLGMSQQIGTEIGTGMNGMTGTDSMTSMGQGYNVSELQQMSQQMAPGMGMSGMTPVVKEAEIKKAGFYGQFDVSEENENNRDKIGTHEEENERSEMTFI